ncbi:hypothetical protein DFH08DRAFT_635721, partial [Mycena albidolilacea]
QLLPRNWCLVRIVRRIQKVCTMLGLSVMTRTRLDHVNDLVRKYECACNEVYNVFGKDFNFLKQHSLMHAIEDFMSKGTSRNMNTRVGKGFQQEVGKMYQKTNGKNAECQAKRGGGGPHQEDADLEDHERIILPVSKERSSGHWKLGSPVRRVSMHRLEADQRGDLAFRDFDMHLREYIAQYHPVHQVRLEQQIQIQQCRVIYVKYQSKVDWRSATDILRCNPLFHGHPRFDSVIYEEDNKPLAVGKLHFVFRCHPPGDAVIDLALARPFGTTAWQPNTRTDCPIRKKLPLNNCHFIALEHIVRGILLCPIFGGQDGMHYIVGCIDEDMYLRVNN